MADALHNTRWNKWGVPNAPSVTNFTIDTNAKGVAAVFQANLTDAITHLGYRYGARTGTPVQHKISLQTVDAATGKPSGTIVGGGSPASGLFTPPATAADDGLWKWIALDNSYTPSRGEILARVIEPVGTPDASNNSSFTRAMTGINPGMATLALPYALDETAGTWTLRNDESPVFGYRTASGRYGIIHQGNYQTADSTTGHRIACQFTLPSAEASTFKLAGLRLSLTTPAATKSVKVGLWNAAGTELSSVTLDADVMNGNGGGRNGQYIFTDATLPTLSFGTKYYGGIEVLGAASVALRGQQLGEAADRSAWPQGTIRGLSTWNGSAWADDDTVLPFIELIFSDVTAPSGGGGIIMNPGMVGGIQRS